MGNFVFSYHQLHNIIQSGDFFFIKTKDNRIIYNKKKCSKKFIKEYLENPNQEKVLVK